MKKYLLLSALLISFGVSAQTLPTLTEQGDKKILQYPDGRTTIISDEGIIACNGAGNCNYLTQGKAGHDNISFQNLGNNTVRVTGMGQIAGDYKLVSADGNSAVMDISSPNYPDKNARAYIKYQGTDEGEFVIKDANTGKTLASGAAKKDTYIRQKMDDTENNRYLDMDLRRTGSGEDDFSGKVKYNSDTDTFDLKITNGKPTGTIRQVQNGYENLITMYSDGRAKVVIKDMKTHKMLYTAYGTEEHMKLYDSKGKVIAEGSEDNMKVYDKKAYAEYERITDDDDDDD